MEEYIEIFLNLHKNELLGWEPSKNSLVIACMIKGIKLGHKFPAVSILHKKGRVYQMVNHPDLYTHGGHHRAVAHYIEEVPLRCNLFESYDFAYAKLLQYSKIPIKDVILKDWKPSNSLLADSLLLLPEDVAKKFCNENALDYNNYYIDHRRRKVEGW